MGSNLKIVDAAVVSMTLNVSSPDNHGKKANNSASNTKEGQEESNPFDIKIKKERNSITAKTKG